MKRGDIVSVAIQGDFGKPRPAVVIQSNLFEETTSVTVLPITSTLIDAPLLRVPVHPSSENGLQKNSQVMVDKTMTVIRERLGLPFGHIDPVTLVQVERCLAVFLGIAK
jgi:mRNA interferase MazF